MSETKTNPCGGCGETDEASRCIGCRHVFQEQPMTDAKLAEIRARRGKITKLPWWRTDPPWGHGTTVHAGPSDDPHTAACFICDGNIVADGLAAEEVAENMDFIAHAPTDIDTLLAHLAAAQEQQAAQAAELERVKGERDSAKQAATAWNALMNGMEAIREAATDPDFTPDQHLNAYIDVYTRLKQENADLETALAAEREKVAALTRERDEARSTLAVASQDAAFLRNLLERHRLVLPKADPSTHERMAELLDSLEHRGKVYALQLAASQSRAERAEGELAKMRECCEQGQGRANNFLAGLKTGPVFVMIHALRQDFDEALGKDFSVAPTPTPASQEGE